MSLPRVNLNFEELKNHENEENNARNSKDIEFDIAKADSTILFGHNSS